MGVLDVFRVFVFSEVRGVVTDNGVPVEGATVERLADYRRKVFELSTKTDSEGRFFFGTQSTWSLSPLMFDTLVFQEITIIHNGKKFQAWQSVKENGHLNGELNLDPKNINIDINLDCELTRDSDERKIVRFNGRINSIYGLCRWESAEVVDADYYPG